MRNLVFVALALVLIALAAWVLLGNRDSAEPTFELSASERPIPDSPYWSASDRWVDVDGITARVRMEGPADAPALLLIHGFSYSLESWDAWAADLAQDYRVIRFDLPGHALTGPDPQARYSVADTVAFTRSLMDALALDEASLVGNSLGGLVAWRLAADHPERVSSLVLLAPGGFSINGVSEEPVPVPAAVAFFLTQGPEFGIAAASRTLFGDPERMPEDLPARVHSLMRQPGVGDALVERLEVFTLPDPRADLARVEAPALIVWGERDVMVPPAHAGEFAAHMPDARIITYSDLGHVPHEEAPARTLADVRAFLDAG
ncbi:alpha/beta fold hydrolase [Maricaulis sp.]|uniref:alpha/beta fold hydrolase n=1 Tax=Maricaulis sp. TaxID=1486257 RepID=UPI00261B2A4C|nr:alpha/beta fold hydrolase [Maricaulis sp.]